MAFINSLSPNSGEQGDRFAVTILGDVFTHATQCGFGTGITIRRFDIIDDGTIIARITIASDAALGSRDLTVTDQNGTATLHSGFTII